jgi:uncharacterized protein
MSRNVDTGNAIYEYFSKGDVPGILDRLVPGVEWEHDWGAPPLKWYVPRRGRAEVVKFFQTLADFELLRFERVAFLEGANVVEVPIPIELRLEPTGSRIKGLEAHPWTFGDDGLVMRMRHLVDSHQFALAAV